jgi:outer membrane lipoprotein-sorting protein
MRKLAPWVVLAVSALAIAACGGGEEVQQPTASPEAFVSASEALDASAVNFDSKVDSFTGTMDVSFSAGGEKFSAHGDMLFQAPDSAYITMDMAPLGRFSALFLAPDFYVNLDGTWYHGDASSAGVDLDEIMKYAQDHGPVDYTDTLKGMKNVNRLPDDVIGGKTYWHYRGQVDPGALTETDGLVDPSMQDMLGEALQNTYMDVWIDPQTLLPRRYKVSMQMDIASFPFLMEMTMDFETFNTTVHMPEAPANAKPLEDSGFANDAGA